MATATTAPTRRDLMTLPEVLAEIGVTRSTFYDWRAKRKAPRCHRLPNGELRVHRAELDRWLRSLEDAA
ncbi:MAG: helix-turn-helix domain-containing protein [Hamadaea sp.]|nr:helix-turn-helix domain-containing protein [Hamadaea sp.]